MPPTLAQLFAGNANPPYRDLLSPYEPLVRMIDVQLARIDDRAGHQRGLFAREIPGALPEVRARGGFAPEDAIAPLDHIQVNLEDAPLRQARLEPPRDEQLA